MLGFCQNWIFGQKFDFSNSVVSKGKKVKVIKEWLSFLHSDESDSFSALKTFFLFNKS